MDRPGDQFFAGTRLAANQNGRVRARDFQNHLLHRFHFWRSRNDLNVDLVQPAQGALDGFQQTIPVERFLQIIERSATQSVLGGIDRPMRRQKENDDRRIHREQMLQQLDAVHTGHLQIR